MIDWHSHVLPGVDDGSRNAEESTALLQMLSEQGVDTVMATPHFLANDESADAFLERRAEAFETLSAVLPTDAPRVMLGAEVKYYQGISRMEDLLKLRIEGTKILLLEMSIAKWTEYTVRELIELSASRDVTVMMAHIERYYRLQSRATWERLYENGLLMQINASFLCDRLTRRRALGMLESGFVRFIGSDCHNMTSRAPKIGNATEIAEKKLGDGWVDQFQAYGKSLLAKKSI